VGRNRVGVRLHLERAAAWFGFDVAGRLYRGAEEGEHRGEGGRRLSPAGSGLSPFEASVFYQGFPSSRVSVVHPTSFDDALVLADRFKRRQVVILNLQRAGEQLSRQMVDFCVGLAYGLDGEVHIVADQLLLLTPREVEVSNEKRERPAERRLFNWF
jgi:cell division inhibitor SepF